MNEIWYPIKGYECHYEISNLGRIRSYITKERGGTIKKYSLSKSGYFTVGLFMNKKTRTFLVHRLVAINFIPNLMNKPIVNHINGIKKDIRIENLEWATSKENVIHGWKMGLCEKTRKVGIDNAKSKKVIDTKTGIIYDTIKEAALHFGINYNTFFGYVSGVDKNPTSLKILDSDVVTNQSIRRFLCVLNTETGIFYDNSKAAANAHGLVYVTFNSALKKAGNFKSFLLV